MNRAMTLAARNRKELLRDPLSYIFCLAFPLVMLIIMTIVNSSIPKEAGVSVFRIKKLAPGIAVFGQAFLMLFTTLSVSKDRAGSFMVRLYATPAESRDFILGYLLPMMEISLMQNGIIYVVSWIISQMMKAPLNVGGLLLSLIVLQFSAVLFICIGLLFGTLFSEKAAPGLCSIIISLSSFLGCIWFDADSLGGVMLKVCKVLPFYYCTKLGRSALELDFSAAAFLIPLLVVVICAAVLAFISIIVFRTRMRADLA